ncbi:MAG: CvpA family protein [Alphaproteobacteria bacterium]|nr:CvpA family protein [Alphaproteobacteria bacterium]
MESELTIVDYVVLGVLLLSGLIAAYRGFLKETLSVSSWLIAALAAVFFWPVTKPFARALLQPDVLADILALIGVFFLILIPASFMSFRLSELVRESSAGPLDRSLGFVFGLARGLLVVGLGYVVFTSLASEENHPGWVREARLLPVVRGTAEVILSLGDKKKKETQELAAEAGTDTTQTSDSAEPVQKPPAADENTGNPNEGGGGNKSTSYSADQRRALDELVKSTSKE